MNETVRVIVGIFVTKWLMVIFRSIWRPKFVEMQIVSDALASKDTPMIVEGM
jgi:hypothetical protein